MFLIQSKQLAKMLSFIFFVQVFINFLERCVTYFDFAGCEIVSPLNLNIVFLSCTNDAFNLK